MYLINMHHKMTVSVMRAYFTKVKPNYISYRSYKKFDGVSFRYDLENALKIKKEISYENFENIYMNVLNKHAPLRQKTVRANESPFMNKVLKKAIMKRSRLRNKYLRDNCNENENAYKKQRNICVNLLRKQKRSYFSRLNINNVTDNKRFWDTIKPLFSDKINKSHKITLIEGNDIISDNQEIAERLNDFFTNAAKSLMIDENIENITDTQGITDPIFKAIKKFEKHPSILKIKEHIYIEK